jgi:hypothetical protein
MGGSRLGAHAAAAYLSNCFGALNGPHIMLGASAGSHTVSHVNGQELCPTGALVTLEA